jgi:hypothetical protein
MLEQLERLTSTFTAGPAIDPVSVLVRLLIALALGGVVAWVYRRTRSGADFTATFPPTLVLLSVLIAMVTQVIGDNVARAFSLVGALSIVRFRTVVRDTQDTAFVIFAVVVGMAVGASGLWVAAIGISVVSLAAFLTMHRPSEASAAADTPFRLELRVASGYDLNGLLAKVLEQQVVDKKLISVGTTKQGMSLGVAYSVRFRKGGSPEELVKALNRMEGVQNVELSVREADVDF